MIKPTATEAKADNNTAPAARSFTVPIKDDFSVVILSASFSMDVLKPSAEKTAPIQIDTRHHSVGEILQIIPAAITNNAAHRCIFACVSLRKSI